jgi:anti-sigma factor RsiW
LFGIIVGGAGTYLGVGGALGPTPVSAEQQRAAEANDVWLDNAAGYYKLTVNSGDNMLIDVPASNNASAAALQKISQNLPQQVRLPDLKPWGLAFRGARLVVAGGRPAAELVYVTGNKAIGPLTLLIGATALPDITPTVDHREGVNLLYWRHRGHAYALVGRADIGYLWGIANDVAWQLDGV